jgi:hypothetical protein
MAAKDPKQIEAQTRKLEQISKPKIKSRMFQTELIDSEFWLFRV